MFSHVTLGVNDLERSLILYDEIMKVLGHKRRSRGDNWAGYGDTDSIGIDTLWILTPSNGKSATAGTLLTYSMKRPSTSVQKMKVNQGYEKKIILIFMPLISKIMTTIN